MINGDNILTIGIKYKPVKGGVAAVISEYSKIIRPFHFIATVNTSNKLMKFLVFLKAIVIFLYYMLFKRNIKIIHIHGASYASFWRKSFFIIIAKIFRKEVIYHIHGGGFKKFSKEHSKCVNYILSKVDIVVVLSESWLTFFHEELKCKDVRIIHNIIEEPVYTDKESKNKNECVFLFLGLICKNKGVYDLLQIIKNNEEVYRGKNKFIIGGNGETDDLLNFIKTNNLEDIVEYAGWVSGKKKADLFNLADVYILPSYFEGLPISILEAMSYHLPIISTNVGGIPEIVRNGINGFLINPGDIEALTKSIFDMADNKENRIKMGEESYKICIPYMASNVKQDLSILYSNLLQK